MKNIKKFIILIIIFVATFSIYSIKFKTVGKNTIPVITYHSVKDENPDNNEYIVKTTDFEKMISSLKDENFTFIDCYDLMDIINRKKTLPENPIMITFDDGYEDNYSVAFDILKKYDAKAVIFLIGRYVDCEGYLNWNQVTEMANSGLIDFESHTFNLHDLFLDGKNKDKTWFSEKLEDESDEHYVEKLTNDLIWNNNLIYQHSSRFPIALSYPGAMINSLALESVKNADIKLGFIGANKSASKLNNLNNYKIKRFHISPNHDIDHMVKFLHSNN